MKKILIFSLFAILTGCEVYTPIVITDKWYTSDKKKVTLPVGICQYEYNNYVIFEDSCNKYSIGDTIKGGLK